MDNVASHQPSPGIMSENVYLSQPATKKQRRASKGMPPMDLNAPGLFTIVPQPEAAKQDLGGNSSRGIHKKQKVVQHPRQNPPWTNFKPSFKVGPNVMVYPASMVPSPMAAPLHPFSHPYAFPPQPRVPIAPPPIYSYSGTSELLPAPTFSPLVDVKIRKLQHVATMRELDTEESTVLKALLQLQKQKMMKAMEFMKLVLPEGQVKDDKPKRMLHRLERAGVKDGLVSIVALVKRRDVYYVCSALDGIPSEGISAVLRLLPGEGVSKPREKATPPEERIEAVLPRSEDFEKLVRFMGTPNATAEARRKCLLSFMCYCYGGKALHAAGYVHACNQVISAEKGTTLARKFQKAQAIHELFARKPGQGMKRKPTPAAGAPVPELGGPLDLGLVTGPSERDASGQGVPQLLGGPPSLAAPFSGAHGGGAASGTKKKPAEKKTRQRKERKAPTPVHAPTPTPVPAPMLASEIGNAASELGDVAPGIGDAGREIGEVELEGIEGGLLQAATADD